MSRFRTRIASASTIILALVPLVPARGGPVTLPTDELRKVVQALNRLTFGPRPGDVKRVTALGLDKWIDAQLDPDSIDDHAVEARLKAFRTLRMSVAELAEASRSPAGIRRTARGKKQGAIDAGDDVIYEEQRKHSELAQNGGGQKATSARSDFMLPLNDPSSEEARRTMAAGEEQVIAMDNPLRLVAKELMESKVLRATYSERQLLEVMTDFWLNHFNVFIGKGNERIELTSYERDVIRPHALGKFEDLLVATAQNPAMMLYLDNWLNVGPNSDWVRGGGRRRGKRKTSARPRLTGLNENYGRELLELHTLGVDGGYSQKNVTEVAKVFTGWTVEVPREGGTFEFDDTMHEPGTKIVLGQTIKEAGQQEGFEVLHILAHSPATANFICKKIAMRFVADNPPPALVRRMATTFLEKNTDIREVLVTMLKSAEFWESEIYHAKMKTPLEFVVSALRATGAEVTDAGVIVAQLRGLGMPLYGSLPPTGYSMKADSWVSSSGLLGRINFAARLASGHLRGVQVTPSAWAGEQMVDPSQTQAALEESILGGDVSGQTHSTIAAVLQKSQADGRLKGPDHAPEAAIIETLLLGSPEFQRR